MEKNQIERYRSVLQNSGNGNTLLIVISKYRINFQEAPDCYIRWFQIANWLDKAINRLKSNESFTQVSQFLEFLRYRYLAVEPVTVQVSSSLKKYIQREGKDCLSLRYMKRSSDLKDDPDLIPLRKLLNVMAFSIEKAFPNDSFGFSNSILGLKGEFNGIGFNIEYRYDFFIDMNDPDTILFKASMRHKLSSTAKLGHGKLSKISEILYWLAQLKISDTNISFLTKSFDEQVFLLSDFLKKSRAIVNKLDPIFIYKNQ